LSAVFGVINDDDDVEWDVKYYILHMDLIIIINNNNNNNHDNLYFVVLYPDQSTVRVHPPNSRNICRNSTGGCRSLHQASQREPEARL